MIGSVVNEQTIAVALVAEAAAAAVATTTVAIFPTTAAAVPTNTALFCAGPFSG